MISRRGFLDLSATAAAGALWGNSCRLKAQPMGLPLGLQLYSVREQLAKDYEATLVQVGKLGYREVEAAGFFGHGASAAKQAFHNAGLHCVSSHHPFADLAAHFDDIIAFGQQLGVQYLICASPGLKTPTINGGKQRAFTLDDWRWNAEQFNRMGERVAAAGMQFGYHNHVREFAVTEGIVPYAELLRLTDPMKVTMELDCGWAVVGGANPVDLLREHPARFSMLHIKDFRDKQPGQSEEVPTALGQGRIDYRPILSQADKSGKIKHVFVEQEAYDMPYLEELKVDADYLLHLST